MGIIVSKLRLPSFTSIVDRRWWRGVFSRCFLLAAALCSCLLLWGTPPASASLNDDRYDGNIFLIYGGNGSLVPPKVTLAESLQRHKPALLVFYADDSSDCKQFTTIVSQLQAYYGREANIIPVSIDAIPVKSSYTPQESGYYYDGLVPQTVLLDGNGKVVFDRSGQVSFEKIDDVFREVFNLLPRSESVELKLKPVNEFNTELVPQSGK
ncbi:MAG: thylakoid membrane photosystem I accumulation factor [Cyanosarcina radialis HA8281-LM2]|jgi:hypothetical protein|nr:thylakoid membrane photosystem I accumulation factor [Cyanosarcina radialis HA8281-LM2]